MAINSRRPKKDSWDKAQVIATVLTPVLTALVGGLFAYWYSQAQVDVQRLESERQLAVARAGTVTNLLPQLSSDNPSVRRAALETVAALGDEAFAIRLAKAFGGEGAVSPVEHLSEAPQLREAAWQTLASLFSKAQSSIGVIQSRRSPEKTLCSAIIIRPAIVLTSGASVHSPPYVFFMPYTGQETVARLLLHDELRGIAIFHVPRLRANPLAIARERADPDDWLSAVGYSRGGLWRALPGRVRRGGVAAHMELPWGKWPPKKPEDLLAGLFFLPGIAEIEIPPGFEGAPLLDDQGQVAGLISSVAQPSLSSKGLPSRPEKGVRFVPLEELQRLFELEPVRTGG